MTAATEKLPHLTNEEWVLRCQNPEQRDELLAWAAEQGVPCWELNHVASPVQIDLGWYGDLMAYGSIAFEALHQVSIADFKQMCKEYAAPTRKHTAPPAEHSLRDLGLGVLLCLLLLCLLPSCAPARLPLETVARPVGHDPRTKLVEPMPTKSVR